MSRIRICAVLLMGMLLGTNARVCLSAPMSDQEFAAIVDQASKAQQVGDWEEEARVRMLAFENRYDAKGFERFWQGSFDALVTALIYSCRCDEAYEIAQYSARKYWDAPDIDWEYSKLVLAKAAMKVGRFDVSSRCFRLVDERHKAEGKTVDMSFWLAEGAVKEFDFSWELTPDHFPKEFAAGRIRTFLPRADLPYQTASLVSVTGAKSYREMQRGQQVWLEAVPDGTTPIRIVAHIKQMPYTYWPQVKALQSAPCFPQGPDDPYVQQQLGVGIILNERSKAIAKALKSPTQYETIRKTLQWCAKNMTYSTESDAYVKNSDDCLKHMKGVCEPLARAAVALLRENGVPARCFRQIGAEEHPAWHTSLEVRSPIKGEEDVWFPVGPCLLDFPLHALMYLYPAVAPDSERAFPWEEFWATNIELFRNSNKKWYYPVDERAPLPRSVDDLLLMAPH